MSTQLKLFLSWGQHSKGKRAIRVPVASMGGVLLGPGPGGAVISCS